MESLDAKIESVSRPRDSTPWQLKMFSKTLKKQQKLSLILKQIGQLSNRRCLLVTHGDNNGAMNHHFRAQGGDWTWVENEPDSIADMQQLLGDPVLSGDANRIPCDDGSMDVVISIDVHEHMQDCSGFNRELARVTRPGGTVVVSTPNGDPWKPVTLLKNLLGMRKEAYGHVVLGYNVKQHQEMLRQVGLDPVSWSSYSKFFTEMIELAINFSYVKLLSRKSKQPVKHGTIAPSNTDQLRSVEKQYRLYSAVYPLLNAISKLDLALSPCTGYAVSVVSRRPK